MIETILHDYLQRKMEIPVFCEMPDEQLGSFILIELTGQSEEDNVFHSTVAIQGYAESLFEAAQLNGLIVQTVKEAGALNDIGAVSLNSAYNYTDTRTNRYRYQAVFDITHY